MKRSVLLLLLTILSICPLWAQLAPSRMQSAAEIHLAIKKLNVLGSVLYIAAHPDDENTAVLAYLSKGRLVRTAYLSLTRGDGGQNLIGSEKGPLLGILRTQELLAARRIDGPSQFFSRALDFGYSKSADETLQFWDREQLLADVVQVIRQFRPDVLLTRFTPEMGGHGQHLTSAILAEAAFSAAADPARFPEQLTDLSVWQPKRILWNAWKPAVDQQQIPKDDLISMDVGGYNALLGKSYTELAALSRSQHKCQGFGVSASRGERIEYFQHTAGERAAADLFDDVRLDWSRVPGAKKVAEYLRAAEQRFDPANPTASIPLLIKARQQMDALEQGYWVRVKRAELNEVIRACSGLWLEAIVSDYTVTRGDSLTVAVTLINQSGYPLQLAGIEAPFGRAQSVSAALQPNIPWRSSLSLNVPTDAPFSHPYWLREPPTRGMFQVDDPGLRGLPENPPPSVRVRVMIDDQPFEYHTPLLFRWSDPVDGEQYRHLEVSPALTVTFEDQLLIFVGDTTREVRVTLKSATAAARGTVRFRAPAGWTVRPAMLAFELDEKGEEQMATLHIRPPAQGNGGELTAEVVSNEATTARSLVRVNYDHIPIQTLYPRAAAKVVRFTAEGHHGRIGYIMGAGDDLPGALSQIGYRVTLLSDDDLTSMDLGGFDALVAGVRAYNTRPRLRHVHQKLLDYVAAGGTYIVQYHTPWQLAVDQVGPWPLEISRERITVEEAPLSFLDPHHTLLNFPNKIGAADLDGWVQERGLYFAGSWDERYQPLLSGHDPGEPPRNGGLLYAPYGDGVFIYTGYSWFRQLPAGVPGAYRMFINLLSARQSQP